MTDEFRHITKNSTIPSDPVDARNSDNGGADAVGIEPGSESSSLDAGAQLEESRRAKKVLLLLSIAAAVYSAKYLDTWRSGDTAAEETVDCYWYHELQRLGTGVLSPYALDAATRAYGDKGVFQLAGALRAGDPRIINPLLDAIADDAGLQEMLVLNGVSAGKLSELRDRRGEYPNFQRCG